jgi:hypothetical protein
MRHPLLCEHDAHGIDGVPIAVLPGFHQPADLVDLADKDVSRIRATLRDVSIGAEPGVFDGPCG